jgi:hypothetical protein
MDFKQAIIWLKEGKKVRMASWTNPNSYIYLGKEGIIYCHNQTKAYFFLDAFISEDWEIYEKSSEESIIAQIMAPLHQKSLNRIYISWGDMMRAGLKCMQAKKQIDEKFFCEKCKNEVTFGDNFCKKCGKTLMWAVFG